jgi:hypothetical protein
MGTAMGSQADIKATSQELREEGLLGVAAKAQRAGEGMIAAVAVEVMTTEELLEGGGGLPAATARLL